MFCTSYTIDSSFCFVVHTRLIFLFDGFLLTPFPMAKQSLIRREEKRQRLVRRYALKRAKLKDQLQNPNLENRDSFTLRQRLQAFPRNSSPTRLHRRCSQTGRPRGVFRDFGLSRHLIRELAHQGCLPGVTKASW